MNDYGIRIKVSLPHGEALARTREALQAQGFGVLTEIDMAGKLKEKLGVDYKRYVILGACNPPRRARPTRSPRESHFDNRRQPLNRAKSTRAGGPTSRSRALFQFDFTSPQLRMAGSA